MEQNLFSKLKKQSTLILFGLGFITLGVYWAHYIKRQSKIINEFLPSDEKKISSGLVGIIIAVGYLAPILFFIDFGLTGTEYESFLTFPIKIIDQIWFISLLIWVFGVRKRIHNIFSAEKGSPYWFNTFWTLTLSVLYINFKINKFNEGNEVFHEHANI